MKKLFAAIISLTLLCSCGKVNTAETEIAVPVMETTAPVTETTTIQTTKQTEQTTETSVKTEAEQEWESFSKSEKIAEIIYNKARIQSNDPVQPVADEPFTVAVCTLIDLTGSGEDELVIQKYNFGTSAPIRVVPLTGDNAGKTEVPKQTYSGGSYFSKLTVYSLENSEELMSMEYTGAGFDVYTNANGDTVMYVDCGGRREFDKYFYTFNKKNPDGGTETYDELFTEYFLDSFALRSNYKYFDGTELITPESRSEHREAVQEHMSSLQKLELERLEFRLTNKDVESMDTLNSVLERIFADTEKTVGKYNYQPPQEVIDTHFYCDDIETEIELQNALSKDFSKDFELVDIFNDPEVEKKLYNAFAENLPQEIVDNMTHNIQSPDWLSGYEMKIYAMSYMKYDFNSDGVEDYFVTASLVDKNDAENYMYMMTSCGFDRMYISEDSGFRPITIPLLSDSINSILSTKTNGLKDLLAFCNSNAPSLKYDGVFAYGGFTELDERHTFINSEILPDNILHLNMNISVIDAPLGEYYTAIKFADNPYTKNNVLYTCYHDGTPRTYIEKPYGEDLPTDFAPSLDGYDFYVELTDEGVGAFTDELSVWYLLDLLEIKYISAE